MSNEYAHAAELLRKRLRELRRQYGRLRDPGQRAALKCRTQALARILTQMNELAELTAHYYERDYYRNEAYRL